MFIFGFFALAFDVILFLMVIKIFANYGEAPGDTLRRKHVYAAIFVFAVSVIFTLECFGCFSPKRDDKVITVDPSVMVLP